MSSKDTIEEIVAMGAESTELCRQVKLRRNATQCLRGTP